MNILRGYMEILMEMIKIVTNTMWSVAFMHVHTLYFSVKKICMISLHIWILRNDTYQYTDDLPASFLWKIYMLCYVC